MVEHDADLVVKYFDKRLNMEFDWKRRPALARWSERYEHVSFHTTPWYSPGQYSQMRSFWEEYTKGHPACIKTLDDFDRFTQYVETRSLIQSDAAKYMRKIDGDVARLRQQLCAAYKQGKAGLAPKMYGFTDAKFAKFLTKLDIKCKKTDVENGKYTPFVPHSCPATEEVLVLLLNFKLHIEHLDEELFLYVQVNNEISLIDRSNPCSFTDMVQ